MDLSGDAPAILNVLIRYRIAVVNLGNVKLPLKYQSSNVVSAEKA
jgi:hypothetical protein